MNNAKMEGVKLRSKATHRYKSKLTGLEQDELNLQPWKEQRKSAQNKHREKKEIKEEQQCNIMSN